MQQVDVLSTCSAGGTGQQRQGCAADGRATCNHDSKAIEGPDHVGSNHEESDKGCVGTSDLCSNGHSAAGEVVEQSLRSKRHICAQYLIEPANKQAHNWTWRQCYCKQSTAGVSTQH